jgi:hypothetical protein
VAAPLAAADEAMLDNLQRDAFGYFIQHTNRHNGLVADTSRPGSHSSIAVVGFALSAYPVGVARGWMTRADALQRRLAALRFFRNSDQSGAPESTGYKGFYFHFLQMDSGARAWRCELSLIDTALLLAGMPPRRSAAPQLEAKDVVVTDVDATGAADAVSASDHRRRAVLGAAQRRCNHMRLGTHLEARAAP